MKDNELVSIIIPTYNRTDTLKRAIDSVLCQTYDNIEIIVVDDNAEHLEIREKNKKLIESYNGKIKFIENQKNLGGGLSRNEGIKVSKGKFVAFLDDDDEYFPTKIEEQYCLYKQLNNDNVAMIYCYAEMVNIDNTTYISNKKIEGNALIEHVNDCIAATSWWFCPKEKLLSVGCFEDISSRQDASLLLKLLLKGYEVYCVPKILLKYYWHDSNSGISSTSLKSVKAEKNYKQIFINNSNEKLNKKTEKIILHIFSFRIAMLYVLLHKRKDAFIELKHMVKLRPLDIKNLRILFGIVLNNLYCYISKKRNYKKGAK